MKLNFLFFLVTIFIFGCNLNTKTKAKPTITGTWKLANIEMQKGNLNANELNFLDEVYLKKILKEGLIINIFRDNSYTRLEGNSLYQFGTYKYDSTNLKLEFKNEKETKIFDLLKLEKDPEENQTLSIKNKFYEMVFQKESEPLSNLNDDPFYRANNNWRIKASKKENTLELKTRVLEYVKHNALLLKANRERKQEVVSFTFSQGPIKIYNGGIGIFPFEDVYPRWKSSFFDNEDALKGYNLFKECLRTNSYNGASQGNWIDDDYNILISIYGNLNETNK